MSWLHRTRKHKPSLRQWWYSSLYYTHLILHSIPVATFSQRHLPSFCCPCVKYYTSHSLLVISSNFAIRWRKLVSRKSRPRHYLASIVPVHCPRPSLQPIVPTQHLFQCLFQRLFPTIRSHCSTIRYGLCNTLCPSMAGLCVISCIVLPASRDQSAVPTLSTTPSSFQTRPSLFQILPSESSLPTCACATALRQPSGTSIKPLF